MRTEAALEPPGLPSRFFLLVGAAAIVASATIPGAPPGINFTAAGALTIAAVWAARGGALRKSDHALAAPVPILLALFAVRSAPWLLALNLGCIGVLVSIAMARARTWVSVPMSAPRTLWTLPHGIAFVLRPVASKTAHDLKLAPVLRTFSMMALAVVVFGGLFASADPAFAALADDFLVPSLDLSMVSARALTAILIVAFAGSLTLRSFGPAPATASTVVEGHPGLGSAEWKATLVLIDLLFAGFVAVQLAVLFGDHDYVFRTTGLTYAEYARQGFLQLIASAAITLAVIAIAVVAADSRSADRTWLRVLLGILCVLTLVILGSASIRLNLYQEAYGFTRLRLLADLVIILLGGIFLMLIVAGTVWKGSWLPRSVVILGAAALIGFNIYNPDARIAEKNVERFSRTGQIDLSYLAGLSPDAVPELMGLPEPERSCVLVRLGEQLADPAAAWSWNIARVQAQKVLRESLQIGTDCPMVE